MSEIFAFIFNVNDVTVSETTHLRHRNEAKRKSERVKMGIEKEVGIQKRQTERWKKDEIFGFCFTYKAINSNAFCDYINFSKLYVHFVDFPRNNFSKWLELLRWLLVAATTVVVVADIACYDIRWYHAVHGFLQLCDFSAHQRTTKC